MSRLIFLLAVCVAVLGLASAALAADDYSVYNSGSGALHGSGPVAYSGPPAPPGMRFGDIGHVMGGEVGGNYGCPDCGFGVPGAYCDPCWKGPCMDWKQIGWYSHWGHGHCCARKCGAAPCGGGGCAPCGY